MRPLLYRFTSLKFDSVLYEGNIVSANKSPDEIVRQMWGRFDARKGAAENSHQTMSDARAKEVAKEAEHRSNRDKGADTAATSNDLGDMGENDSLGG